MLLSMQTASSVVPLVGEEGGVTIRNIIHSSKRRRIGYQRTYSYCTPHPPLEPV